MKCRQRLSFVLGSQLGIVTALLKRHLVKDARSRNAVCNDGSPAVYYFEDEKSPERLKNGKWMFWLEGGGDCYSDLACIIRWQGTLSTGLMSTGVRNRYLDLQTTPEQPLAEISPAFSNDCDTNPAFCEFNKVRLVYCSSDKWSGDYIPTYDFPEMPKQPPTVEDKYLVGEAQFDDPFLHARQFELSKLLLNQTNPRDVPYASMFYFQGHNIIKAVVEDVMQYITTGKAQPDDSVAGSTGDLNIVFAGSSAGGVGAMTQGRHVMQTIQTALNNANNNSVDSSNSGRTIFNLNSYNIIVDSGWDLPGVGLKPVFCETGGVCNLEAREKLAMKIWTPRVDSGCAAKYDVPDRNGESTIWKCFFGKWAMPFVLGGKDIPLGLLEGSKNSLPPSTNSDTSDPTSPSSPESESDSVSSNLPPNRLSSKRPTQAKSSQSAEKEIETTAESEEKKSGNADGTEDTQAINAQSTKTHEDDVTSQTSKAKAVSQTTSDITNETTNETEETSNSAKKHLKPSQKTGIAYVGSRLSKFLAKNGNSVKMKIENLVQRRTVIQPQLTSGSKTLNPAKSPPMELRAFVTFYLHDAWQTMGDGILEDPTPSMQCYKRPEAITKDEKLWLTNRSEDWLEEIQTVEMLTNDIGPTASKLSYFLPDCYNHAVLTTGDEIYSGDLKIRGKNIAQALGEWMKFVIPDTPVKKMDHAVHTSQQNGYYDGNDADDAMNGDMSFDSLTTGLDATRSDDSKSSGLLGAIQKGGSQMGSAVRLIDECFPGWSCNPGCVPVIDRFWPLCESPPPIALWGDL